MSLGWQAGRRVHTGAHVDRVAFPMGGIGAGMVCLEGTGALSHVSLSHTPKMFNEPLTFGALYVKGALPSARVLEGPVPRRKVFGEPNAANGGGGHAYGLPRFGKVAFSARFPFATIAMEDSAMPVKVELTGWSPFIPGDADNSSLPVAGLEYRFINRTAKPVHAVFSFHASNFMRAEKATGALVQPLGNGFRLSQPPVPGKSWEEGHFAVSADRPAKVDCAWFRGGWFDPLTVLWNNVMEGRALSQPPHKDGEPGGGGSLYVPFTLKARGETTIRLRLAWYVPHSLTQAGGAIPPGGEPFIRDGWHASRMVSAMDIARAPYQGLASDAGWEKLPDGWDMVDIHSRRPGVGIVYLATRFTLDQAAERILHVGHDGGVRIFVDGLPVGATPGKVNPVPVTRTTIPVKLSAGEHELCIALDRCDDSIWGFHASLQQPESCCGSGCDCGGNAVPSGFHRPWYASRFAGLAEVADYWRRRYKSLRASSATFAACFYDTTLPREVVDAAAANLSILKSPTCLRDPEGRLWAWEGCGDNCGCCHGSCTHVWNYAQAVPHLFPSLERTLRETEFLESQDQAGHQDFRATLPIRGTPHTFHAAADGQLGGVMKLYREWRISGNTDWMKSLWPRARRSLEFCIGAWDPSHTGTLVEPHHNTYDIEFWGADGMCTSFYLGALQAAVIMGRACGDDVADFETLLEKGRRAMESGLWNGEYFIQTVQWKGLRAGEPTAFATLVSSYKSPESQVVLKREGPKYQYGTGCLSDGILGDWMARCCGLGGLVDPVKSRSHVAAIFKYNFRRTLEHHSNPQRPTYALGKEAGLLLCSWPRGGKPTLPFVYSDEVWTGIEYSVASHLIMMGLVREGLAVVKAVRSRYDGSFRNPFNEYECGHWYARAMSSFALLQALSGARYDAVEKVLHLAPAVSGDFRAFLATATGYGTVGVRNGKPFVEVRSGRIPVRRIEYRA